MIRSFPRSLIPHPVLLSGSSARGQGRQTGFSLTELLVVIAIIVLLVGILLVALGKVQGKAKRTQTEATMTQFMNACTAFRAEHGRYPGVIPEPVLAANPQITSTENALLDLMGGFRVLSPTDARVAGNPAYDAYQAFLPQANLGPLTWATPTGDWDLIVDTSRLGDGPVINGKPYAAYYIPGAADLARASYPNTVAAATDIPDLIDPWGQPILYFRQERERGPLLPDGSTTAPQFRTGGVAPYVKSTALGELSLNQMTSSILNTAPDATGTQLSSGILYKAFVHASIANQARGGICLISAGPDGIYYSATDGPGSSGDPIDGGGTIQFNVITGANAPAKIMDEFDDVRVFGGA